MSHHFIEPEVAGELGENSILDASVHPPKVDKLHYKFSDWFGDVILESFPCFIVTKDAAIALRGAGVTGVRYSDVEVSASDDFRAMYPGRELPNFEWLEVMGSAGVNDFGIASDFRLVVSEKAIAILKSLGLSNALVESF